MKNPMYFDTQNFSDTQMYFVDTLELSTGFPLHRHSFVELEYIRGGRGVNVVNGVEYPLSEGELSLLMPWHVHELKTDKEHPLQIWKCSFRTDFLATGKDSLGKLSRVLLNLKDYRIVTRLDEASRGRFEQIFQLTLEESKKNAKYKDASMAAFISELVILFLRCSQPLEQEGFTVWDVVRHVQTVYRDPELKGKDVAAKFGYSAAQLNRLLKEHTGLTFFEILQETRVRSAAYLLLYTDMDIIDVALAVGYKSRGGLYTAFSRMKGMSPALFREKNRGYMEQGESLIYSVTHSRLLYFLHKHYAEDLTLDEVAKEFHYNKSYLCQLLARDHTTFHDTLNEIRIYNACKLLATSEKSVEVIAAEVGFGSVKSFYENFRKFRKRTPGEYREEMSKSETSI